MEYREFTGRDFQASALGFGCMRLPTGGDGKIDEPEATRMIRHAIDSGVNYVDTAYGYHGGNSELVVGRALKDGYREKVKVATKLPSWNVKKRDDMDRILNEQLGKLQIEHIDFYLLHSLNKKFWDMYLSLDVFSWAERALSDGRIGCLGFSFHDDYEAFETILTGWDKWAFAQIQYNYVNEEVQAGTKGLELAAARGVPVIVMEPLLGGNLVDPPQAIRKLWDVASREWSPAEWALQWLWNKPEVALVLSGMSTMEQVEENLASAGRSGIGTLSDEETALVSRVGTTYEKIRPIPCTSCNYCMPCPHGVQIPRNLNNYNTGVMYNLMDRQKQTYAKWKDEEKASACTGCKECEEKCPQKITISEWMERIDSEMAG